MTASEGEGRRRGVLADWNDDRGFGFIVPTGGGPRVFAHVKAFPSGRRPVAGRELTYLEGRERGRPCAVDVRYPGALPSAGAPAGMTGAIGFVTAFFAALAILVEIDRLPWGVVLGYGLVSVLTFLMYRADKLAARRGAQRAPERVLHLAGLFGGWPGALVARHLLRHKTVKQPFRSVYWLTVATNIAALAGFLLSELPHS